MAALDPVEWDDIVAATGRPAADVVARIDRMADDLRDEPAYDAVKAVHDSLAADSDADLPPGQGEVFVVAYLLEERGVIDPPPEWSVVDRRPTDDRLEAMFWDPPQTMWWVAVGLGVHWALVRYWLWEADVPLRERNFTDETLATVESHRSEGG